MASLNVLLLVGESCVVDSLCYYYMGHVQPELFLKTPKELLGEVHGPMEVVVQLVSAGVTRVVTWNAENIKLGAAKLVENLSRVYETLLSCQLKRLRHLESEFSFSFEPALFSLQCPPALVWGLTKGEHNLIRATSVAHVVVDCNLVRLVHVWRAKGNVQVLVSYHVPP